MINTRFEPSPNLYNQLLLATAEKTKLATIGAAELLEARLSLHETSGQLWTAFGLPNRSSAPGEYPQEQSGQLAAGVKAITSDPFEMKVGIFDVPHVGFLEYADEDDGGRQTMYMHFVRDWDETREFMELRANNS